MFPRDNREVLDPATHCGCGVDCPLALRLDWSSSKIAAIPSSAARAFKMTAWLDNPLLDRRFLLLGVLGEGGMGRVYRAFDRVEERAVALKVPFEEADTAGAHPLAIEFDTWFRLRHPNIVRAYELARASSGPLPPGTPYLVLESFAGSPAHRALMPGRIDPLRVEALARRVLHALEHVHLSGVVHRDLKPSNILVGPRSNRVKLIDFGLASPVGRAGEPGRFSGSIPFAAPETLLGAPLDGRADLYGLGIVLYLLATGAMPVDSRDPGEVLRWHLHGPPLDPRAVSEEIPERLAQFIRRLTSRNPTARPRSATEALVCLGPGRLGPRPATGRSLERWRLAALRLAVDAAGTGSRRCLELPRSRTAFGEMAREAELLSQRRGLSFYRLRRAGRRGASNLDRVLLRSLMCRGGARRRVGCSRILLEGRTEDLCGGSDMGRRIHLREIADETARLILDPRRPHATVLVVERDALDDPVARRVVRRIVDATTERRVSSGAGLLVLLTADARERLGRRRTGYAVPTRGSGAA
jgi:hypothetical protein